MASGRQKTSPPAVRKAVGQAQAVQLRIQGYTYQTIAEHIGITKGTAHKWVSQAMRASAEASERDALSELGVDLARIDIAMKKVMALVERSDLAAVDRLIRLIDRRAKLLGLDATDREPDDSLSEEEIQRELNGLINEEVERRVQETLQRERRSTAIEGVATEIE